MKITSQKSSHFQNISLAGQEYKIKMYTMTLIFIQLNIKRNNKVYTNQRPWKNRPLLSSQSESNTNNMEGSLLVACLQA